MLKLLLTTQNAGLSLNYVVHLKTLISLVPKLLKKPFTNIKPRYHSTAQLDFTVDLSKISVGPGQTNLLSNWFTVDTVVKPIRLHLKPIAALFKTFTTFNTAFTTYKSARTHTNYRLLYTVSHRKGVKFISMSKLFRRWVNMYHLLVNIFLYRTNLLVFGSITFKEELLAINWNLGTFKYKFFKYASPYFFFKDASYGSEQTNHFFSLLRSLGYGVLIMTNPRDLEKSVHFLRTADFYMIAPIPYTMDPWLVSFPVPTVNVNLFTQLFFLKFIIFTQQQAYSVRFKLYNNCWANVC